MIRVHRGGEDLGYLSQDFATECVKKGILSSDDWAFCDGLTDWVCLGELLGIEANQKNNLPPILPVQTIPLPLSSSKTPPITGRTLKQNGNPVIFVALGAFGIFIFCLFIFLLSAPQTNYQKDSSLNDKSSNTPSSSGVAYYETQIREGILVVEPNHKFTTGEEAQIHYTAEQENKLHPR